MNHTLILVGTEGAKLDATKKESIDYEEKL